MSPNFNRRVPSIFFEQKPGARARTASNLSENKTPLDKYRLYSIFTALPERDVECIVSPDAKEAFFACNACGQLGRRFG